MDNLADFGITQLPVQEKKLQVVKIHSDEIKLLVPPGHRLASFDRVVPRDLLGEQLLLPKTGTTRARLNHWLDPVQDELNISMELDSTEMIKRFVMANLGLSFLAASHCGEEVAAGKVANVPLGPESMVRRVGLIYRRDKSLSKAALGFIQVTLAHAGQDVESGGQLLRASGS
jgi:DNA-binding transcriptional LysR family regulator